MVIDVLAKLLLSSALRSLVKSTESALWQGGEVAGDAIFPVFCGLGAETLSDAMRIAGADRIGITCTKSGMLLPQRSDLALAAIYTLDGTEHVPTPCAACEKTNCTRRPDPEE